MNKIINIVSLGCSKNLVDAESLMKQLDSNKFKFKFESQDLDYDIVIINTCGFIGDAKEESVNTILEYVELKKEKQIESIYVMGCLSERYKDELRESIPEVDQYYGKFEWKNLLSDLKGKYHDELENERLISTSRHFAYLKISEGCNRTCSYCAIPIITGKHKSRRIEDIIFEAKTLADNGVKELLVIAQDLSYYGIDLYKESKLATLIEKLSEIEGIEWIKLHYAYPAKFPFDVLEIMRTNPKVCRYLDIALQHSSDNMLSIMRRAITKEQTKTLINKIRKEVPGIKLRTTMMVGHPGETEADFEDMMEFVKEMKFERLGVFTYSEEEDTYSANNYEDNIDPEVKEERMQAIMDIQQDISLEHNNKLIGQELKVIIDREDEDFYYGRTEFDSFEVDPEVLISKEKYELNIGEFYNLKINACDEYDLYVNE